MHDFKKIDLPKNILVHSLIFIAILVIYYILNTQGQKIISFNPYAPPIWIASGLAVGIVTLLGNWLLPAIFLGATISGLITQANLSSALAAGISCSVEAYVGSYIVLALIRKNFFGNYTDLFTVTISSIIASLIGATLGVYLLLLAGTYPQQGEFFSYWFNWWVGNSIRIMVILPLVLELGKSPSEKITLNISKVLIGLTLTIICFISIYLVFVKSLNHAFSWSLAPVFIILGILLGRKFSRLLLILISIFIAFLTSMGFGPFGQGDFNLNLIYVQSVVASYSFASLFVGPLHPTYKMGHKYLTIIAIGWGLFFSVIYSISYFERKNTLLDFRNTTYIAQDDLKKTSNQYELLLSGAAEIYSLRPDITKEEWRKYALSIQSVDTFNSMRGIGVIKEISNHQKKTYEKTNGPIKFKNTEFAKKFKNHFVIKYIEPLSLYGPAIGLDVGSEHFRRDAIEKAKASRKTIATDPITFDVENSKQGFLIFRPVINLKKEITGFIYVPVLSSNFFKNIFEKISHLIKIKVSTNGKEVYRSFSSTTPPFKNDQYYQKNVTTFMGNEYEFEFYPTSRFFSRHSGSSIFIALLLNLLMLFISVFLLDQMTLGQRAESLAEKRSKELENSKIQLINSSKMASLGEMASGLAHEINNPLAIIQGKVKVVTLMLEDLNVKDEALFKEIDKIKITTDRIEKIIKGLRNFSRSSKDDPFELISIRKIVLETLELCGEKLNSEKIQLKLNNLPTVSVMCRSSQISQVMINLLNNASDAITDQSEKWIEIDYTIKNDKLLLFFTDSGAGIPPALAAKIMEPFFTTKAVSKGTGLGLSIAKNIIESHNGNFWLDSHHSHTRFVIELPLG